MAIIDASTAGKIPRTPQRVGPLYKIFGSRLNDQAKWWSYMRTRILPDMKSPATNPNRTKIEDPAAFTDQIKEMAKDLGGAIVGVADFKPELTFTDAEELGHKTVIVIGMPMAFDIMVDIGPESQEDVHRVYFQLDELATRLAHRISAFGYSAKVQSNQGDLPLPAYGQLAGLGELGKHGSLISPDLGSAFRLTAVSTDMPLAADGAKDYGIDEICASCDICTRFCPGSAIKPQKANVAGAVRWQVDSPACHPHFLRMYGCKICLSVCPMNARGSLKAQYKAVAKDIREAKDAIGMLDLIAERSDLKFDDFNKEVAKIPPEERKLVWWGEARPLETTNFDKIED